MRRLYYARRGVLAERYEWPAPTMKAQCLCLNCLEENGLPCRGPIVGGVPTTQPPSTSYDNDGVGVGEGIDTPSKMQS